MKITYQDLQFNHKEIVIPNAVNVRINGIKITEKDSNALMLSVDERIQVCPNASNSITVKSLK